MPNPAPIPTQLNIAPRGKTWKNWQLVDGTEGFPTRETMEKFHCNPERVRELEQCRELNLETIERQAALIQLYESQLEAIGAGGVEQAPFMYAIADGYSQPFFEEQGCVSSEAEDLQPEVDSLNETLDGEPPYRVVALYTRATQQGIDAKDTDVLNRLAAWCDAQAASDWYGRKASDMVRAFAANAMQGGAQT